MDRARLNRNTDLGGNLSPRRQPPPPIDPRTGEPLGPGGAPPGLDFGGVDAPIPGLDVGNTGSLAGDRRADQAAILSERFAGILPDDDRLRKRDIPLINLRLNLLRELQRQDNIGFGRDVLSDALRGVGQDPLSLQAETGALDLFNSDPLAAAQLQFERDVQQREANTRRAFDLQTQQALARSGAQGGVTPLALAQFEQTAGANSLAALRQAAPAFAQARASQRQQALAALTQQAQERELRRIQLQGEIADLVGRQDLPSFDLSGLIERIP